MEKHTSAHITALWAALSAIALLLLANLACAQAGEILTPVEATARAEATQNPVRPTATPGAAQEGSLTAEGPQVGDVVYLTGKGFLISLVSEPGATRMIAGQERGVEVTIIEIAEHEGELWYKIDAPTGEGWVPAENITADAP
jgi:hypothetical protein